MRKVIVIISCFFLSACSTAPLPLEYGKDQCQSCRMTLIDEKFGAELITNTGKVFKFDDVRCFLDYYHQAGSEKVFEQKLIVDFNHPGKLIPAMEAFYIKSDSINSPMSSHIIAVETETEMRQFIARNGGIFMPWGEVITQFK